MDFNKEISGNDAFIKFLTDKNHTLLEKGLKNAINAMMPKQHFSSFDEDYPQSKYRDLIVVHLKFMEPKMYMVGTKYTTPDLIANFGGNFGLFEQLTGWSFLGMLNLLLVIIKQLFYKK